MTVMALPLESVTRIPKHHIREQMPTALCERKSRRRSLQRAPQLVQASL